MIFITVGTEHPFDRLIKAVDHWAATHGRHDFYAQIGHGAWKPHFIPFVEMMTHAELLEYLQSAELIISHAGMGTILSAMKYRKKIIVLPKKEKLGEHRNDHQMATCRRLQNHLGLNVAFDESDVLRMLEYSHLLLNPEFNLKHSHELLSDRIRNFILDHGN
jgi:UDP-N-acetylglucosamine transferase subunit ALG13